MFEAFLMTLIVVGWCVVSGFLLWRLLDGSKLSAIGVVAWCAASVFFVLYAGMEESKRGPCVEWQTQMMYNAAAKMMQPAKFCAQRGEWEE